MPRGGMTRGTRNNLVGISGNALTMKRWRNDAALANVNGIIGSDEPFAKKDLHAPDRAFLYEGGGLCDQNLTDVVRIVKKDDRCAHEAIVGDGAVGAMKVLEQQN